MNSVQLDGMPEKQLISVLQEVFPKIIVTY